MGDKVQVANIKAGVDREKYINSGYEEVYKTAAKQETDLTKTAEQALTARIKAVLDARADVESASRVGERAAITGALQRLVTAEQAVEADLIKAGTQYDRNAIALAEQDLADKMLFPNAPSRTSPQYAMYFAAALANRTGGGISSGPHDNYLKDTYGISFEGARAQAPTLGFSPGVVRNIENSAKGAQNQRNLVSSLGAQLADKEGALAQLTTVKDKLVRPEEMKRLFPQGGVQEWMRTSDDLLTYYKDLIASGQGIDPTSSMGRAITRAREQKEAAYARIMGEGGGQQTDPDLVMRAQFLDNAAFKEWADKAGYKNLGSVTPPEKARELGIDASLIVPGHGYYNAGGDDREAIRRYIKESGRKDDAPGIHKGNMGLWKIEEGIPENPGAESAGGGSSRFASPIKAFYSIPKGEPVGPVGQPGVQAIAHGMAVLENGAVVGMTQTPDGKTSAVFELPSGTVPQRNPQAVPGLVGQQLDSDDLEKLGYSATAPRPASDPGSVRTVFGRKLASQPGDAPGTARIMDAKTGGARLLNVYAEQQLREPTTPLVVRGGQWFDTVSAGLAQRKAKRIDEENIARGDIGAEAQVPMRERARLWLASRAEAPVKPRVYIDGVELPSASDVEPGKDETSPNKPPNTHSKLDAKKKQAPK